MDSSENVQQNESKPVMLFGRDIRTVPCFKSSVLYGIYSGFAAGLAAFLFTSRIKLATNVALGSYMGVATVYWCYCRYNYIKDKYTVIEMQQLLLQPSENQIFDGSQDSETKLEDA